MNTLRHHLHAVQLDMTFVTDQKIYVAVNPAAGIPTAVRSLRIVRHHLDFIVLADAKLVGQIHVKPRVPMRADACDENVGQADAQIPDALCR